MCPRVRIKTEYLELHVRHLLSGFSTAVSTLTQPAAAQVYFISTQASKIKLLTAFMLVLPLYHGLVRLSNCDSHVSSGNHQPYP